MKRIVALSLLVAGSALADPSRAAVEKLLAGYEPTARASDFRALGAGVDRALIAIAEDAAVSRLRRGRALHALGFVPSVEGRDYLRARLATQRAASDGADLLDLEACLRALGHFGADTVADLVPFLTHPHPEARAAAAKALAATGAPGVRGTLTQRLAAERDRDVQAAIASALATLPPR